MSEWRPVVGYEGLYEVSDDGRVRNSHGVEKALTARQPRWYICVSLSKGGKTQICKVHPLVALAFIPNDDPIGKPHVNHIDNSKLNNHRSNLEWISNKDNQAHAARLGAFDSVNAPRRARKVPVPVVAEIRARGRMSWAECKGVADELGCSTSHIFNIVRGKKRVRG